MHAKGFIHKDIKPDNILLTSSQNAKIGDMGVSAYKSGNYCYDFLAPMNYSAPEVIL
jgi:serine/threonine protein kinase